MSLDLRYLEFENSFNLEFEMPPWGELQAPPGEIHWCSGYHHIDPCTVYPDLCVAWAADNCGTKVTKHLQRSLGRGKVQIIKGRVVCFIDLYLFGNVWNILFCFWCMGTMDLPPPLRRAYSQWTRQRLQLLKRRGSRLWRMVGWSRAPSSHGLLFQR